MLWAADFSTGSTDERSYWADFSVCYTAFLLCLYLSFEEFIYNDTAEANIVTDAQKN